MFGKAANAGGSQEPDFEKIADLNPDVVLGYKSSLENGVADELKGMGVPFVVCECNRIQTFEKDVEEIRATFQSNFMRYNTSHGQTVPLHDSCRICSPDELGSRERLLHA